MRTLIVSFFCVIAVMAGVYSARSNNAFAQVNSIVSITGIVTSVDAANAVFSVNDTISEKAFYVNADTVISRGEELISLSDIHTADTANVSYSTDTQGTHTATVVVVYL